MSSHIGARVGFPLYRRSHFGEFRRPDVAPEESSLARILLEVHGFEHTIPGVHVEKKKKSSVARRENFFKIPRLRHIILIRKGGGSNLDCYRETIPLSIVGGRGFCGGWSGGGGLNLLSEWASAEGCVCSGGPAV